MSDENKVCPVCTVEMKDVDEYCWRCGHKWVEKQHLWIMGMSYTAVHDAWIKNPLIQIDAVKVCPECGYDLDHEHQRFCPGWRALNWSCVHGGRGNMSCRHRTD